MARTFKVASTITGKKHTVDVTIFPTQEMMLDFLLTNHPEGKWTEGTMEGRDPKSLGGFSNEHGFMSNEAPEFVGTIWLCEEALGLETVVHEVTHAAIFIYSCDRVFRNSKASEHMTVTNEEICYLVGDLTVQVVDGIRDLGLYKYGGGMC